jgi:hypothetical protein
MHYRPKPIKKKMTKFFYWQNWQQPYRAIFWLLLIVFVVMTGTILSLQVIGVESLLDWHVLTQQSSYTIDYSIFSKGPFSFSIMADKKVLSEFFIGGEMPDTSLAVNSILALIAVGALLYLSVVTMLSRLWYLIAMGFMLIFLVLLDIGVVQLFGWSDTKVLILIFIILLSPSYYLHAFSGSSTFVKRLWVMAAALAIVGSAIFFFSTTEYPFSTLINYGILAPYILILLFIISVAHETIALFINVITSTEGIGNNSKMRHFLIISAIYLANILLSYLYTAHYIDWQLLYINPFFLLVISATLGVWGSRARAPMYVGASNEEALWPILHMVISIVSMGTLIFFMMSLNDPILKVLGDIIIYAHLAVGVSFFLYVIYNFISLIEKGYKTSKILYNPTNLPFFTYRLMSIMIIVGLFAVRGFDYPVWYSLGGYENVKADMALVNGYEDVAEAYYANGDGFAYHNHKSNYSLGMMAKDRKPTEAIEYFGKAMDQQPTSQTVMNKAHLQNMQMDLYSALFTLQTGSELLDNNVHLNNNLALQFEKVKVLDSATYYFAQAGGGNKQVNNNRLAHSAKHNIALGKDSAALFNNLDRAGRANASAFGYIQQLPALTTANHMFDMVLLNNWLLTEEPKVSDGSLNSSRAIIDSTSDTAYREQLLHSWSLAAYRAGNVAAAIEVLKNLAFNSTLWSQRAKLDLGKIYLALGAYNEAVMLFSELTGANLSLELAVAYLESGFSARARPFWQAQASAEDEFLSRIAKDIMATVYADEPSLDSDQKRYLYTRYSRHTVDDKSEDEILKLIKDSGLRIDLALDLASFYHEFDQRSGALRMLENVAGLSLNKNQLRRYILLQALVNPDSQNVQQRLIQFDSLFSFKESEYVLESTLNHLAGITLDSTAYLHMALDNPFFPDAVLSSLQYFESEVDPFISYDFLVDAVQNNPGSPRLLRAYILKALDVGLDHFAQTALTEYNERFSAQSFALVKIEYDKKVEMLKILAESELLE